MQPGDAALHEREARAGDLRRRGEIELPQLLADVDVVPDREVERARRAPAALLDIVVGRLAGRHALVRRIGNHREEIVQPALHFFGLLLQLGQARVDGARLGHQRRGVLAFRLGLADPLGEGIAGCAQCLGLALNLPALVFQSEKFILVENETPCLEARHYGVQVGAQELDVDHLRFLSCASFSRDARRRSGEGTVEASWAADQ